MRDGQTRSLLVLCSFFIKACLSADGAMVSESARARLNQSASLSCRVGAEVRVVQSEWTRCTDSSSIAVFNPGAAGERGAHVNQPYTDLVSITHYHTLTFREVQDEDFGEYCCKVTTFPSGSLEARVQLLREQDRAEGQEKDEQEPKNHPAALPVMTVVSISCGVFGFVLLTIIISLLLFKKRRRKVRNLVHVTVMPSISPNQPSLLQKDSHTASHTASRKDDDADYDEYDMYLDVMSSEPQQSV